MGVLQFVKDVCPGCCLLWVEGKANVFFWALHPSLSDEKPFALDPRRGLPVRKCLLWLNSVWILSTQVNAGLSVWLAPQFQKAETGGFLELTGWPA